MACAGVFCAPHVSTMARMMSRRCFIKVSVVGDGSRWVVFCVMEDTNSPSSDKDTNKRAKSKTKDEVFAFFSERKYLRRSQRYENFD